MTERKRQLLLAYRESLMIAFGITVFVLPASPIKTPPALATLFGVSGFLFGTCFFLLFRVRERVRLRSFVANIAAQTILMAITVALAGALDIWTILCLIAHGGPFHPDVSRAWAVILQPRFAGPGIVGGTLLAGLINAVFAIDRKLGPGVLWHWITGKYYNPKEEERIFMFLDMKDSTGIAERLGSVQFSALVRDFFRDLTYPVLESRGEVSHYIGDEVVLTWKTKDGIAEGNCIQIFYRMKKAIRDRSEFYRSTYGSVPEFKAGAHVGRVVATEVGEIKSEIVYHGDPLNTTARIQGLCNEEGCDLLISGELAHRLSPSAAFSLRHVGQRKLKGRKTEVEIFAVQPSV